LLENESYPNDRRYTAPITIAPIVADINIACVIGRIIMQQFCKRKIAPNYTALLPYSMRFLKQMTKRKMNTEVIMRPLPIIISELYEIVLAVSFIKLEI
jgi:hypothetical protein